jgi:hypothetical protein
MCDNLVRESCIMGKPVISVPDPGHFDTDPYPDPWVRILDFGYGSGSGSFSLQQKICFFHVIEKSHNSTFHGSS